MQIAFNSIFSYLLTIPTGMGFCHIFSINSMSVVLPGQAIEKWLSMHNTSPMTGAVLAHRSAGVAVELKMGRHRKHKLSKYKLV